MISLKDHARYAIASAQVRPWPFPHAIVRGLFDEAFYDRLVAALPPQSAYVSLSSLGRVSPGAYEQRGVITIDMAGESGPLRELFDLAMHWEFGCEMLRPFGLLRVIEHFESDCLLVKDSDGYKIAPHTDVEARIVSLLAYLPPRIVAGRWRTDMGTSLYVPKLRGFESDGKAHGKFEAFDCVATAPFHPNTALLFPRTSTSFHGVPPISLRPAQRRDLFLVNLRWPRA